MVMTLGFSFRPILFFQQVFASFKSWIYQTWTLGIFSHYVFILSLLTPLSHLHASIRSLHSSLYSECEERCFGPSLCGVQVWSTCWEPRVHRCSRLGVRKHARCLYCQLLHFPECGGRGGETVVGLRWEWHSWREGTVGGEGVAGHG